MDWFKRHFIPQKGNGHRPHILHGKNARRIIVGIFTLELVLFFLPTFTFFRGLDLSGQGANVLSAVLSDLTNQEREKEALAPLAHNSLLDQAAQLKAEDMAAKGYFAHVSPEGRKPWYWLDQVGYTYQYAGENLAIDFSDSKDVTDAWMKSPTHRANIEKAAYTEVGTGIAKGMYEGHETIFVAQLYANPRIDKVPEVETITPSEEPNVLGAEVMPVTAASSQQETVVAVEPRSSSSVTRAEPTEPTASVQPNAIEKAVASPRHTMNIALLAVFSAMLATLLLFILKTNVRHRDLLANGMAVIVFIFAIYIFNDKVIGNDVAIASTDQGVQASAIDY